MNAAEAKSSLGSPFWRFSLAFYRQPNVADACIALQEEAGVDVNLLLFLLWHATLGQALSAAEVEALEGRIAPWREATVIPLRAVRRALKSPPQLVAGAVPHQDQGSRARGRTPAAGGDVRARIFLAARPQSAVAAGRGPRQYRGLRGGMSCGLSQVGNRNLARGPRAVVFLRLTRFLRKPVSTARSSRGHKALCLED
jgi:uncharacterized protein (TIGR02444 family)